MHHALKLALPCLPPSPRLGTVGGGSILATVTDDGSLALLDVAQVSEGG